MGLRRWLTADAFVDRVENISLDELRHKGITALALDLDNTLAPWNESEISPSVRCWLEEAKEKGFRICIVSNAHSASRVAAVAKDLGVAHVPTAWKPRRSGFRKAMALFGANPSTTAVIGDQLLTDVLGGKRVGALTFWVNPISSKEFFTTRIVRRLERLIVTLAGLPNPMEEAKGKRRDK